jgi:inhibitor of KinA
MRLEELGDRAYILRDLDEEAYKFAARLNAANVPGLLEAYASYDTIGIEVDPECFSPDLVTSFVAESGLDYVPRRHVIPACYELGEDFHATAELLDLEFDELVRIHSSITYRCRAVGFCPGFPYLSELSERISGVTRRPSPRVRVPPGSIGITGRQTGVYPIGRPGGWALVAQTPLTLVDVADRYFPIVAGDEVRFEPIGLADYESLRGERL